MRMNIRQSDERILAIGLGFRRKILDTVVKASARCEVDDVSPPANALAVTEAAERSVAAWAKRDRGFNGAVDIAEPERAAMWNGVFLYLEELGKVAEKQTTLGVDVADTNARIRLAQNLSDRLHGKLSMFDDPDLDAGHQRLFGHDDRDGLESVTVSGGGKSVTMTGEEFSRAAEKMERAARDLRSVK